MFEVYGYYGIYDLVRYCRMGRQYLILPSPASEGYFLVILVSVCLMTSIVASFTVFLATLQSRCGFGHDDDDWCFRARQLLWLFAPITMAIYSSGCINNRQSCSRYKRKQSATINKIGIVAQ